MSEKRLFLIQYEGIADGQVVYEAESAQEARGLWADDQDPAYTSTDLLTIAWVQEVSQIPKGVHLALLGGT